LIQVKAASAAVKAGWRSEEGAMPIIDILILAVIVSMFLVFGTVLAWGEYQTRNISHLDRWISQKSGRQQAGSSQAAARDAGDAVTPATGATRETAARAPTRAERTTAHFG
jgi:hypothetical protein